MIDKAELTASEVHSLKMLALEKKKEKLEKEIEEMRKEEKKFADIKKIANYFKN